MDRAFGLAVPTGLEEVCHPNRTALIVYDMQVGIVSQIPEGRTITERVRQLLEAARAAGFRVFFTRYLSLPNETAGVGQLRRARSWQRASRAQDVVPAFCRDSPASQITPEIAPLSQEAVVDRITMSAFEGTFLDIALRDCGLHSFLIAGIALDVGIEPTVRHACDLNYIPIVVTDACGYGNAEAAGRALAGLTFAGEAILVTSETVLEQLRRFAPGMS